MGQGQEEEHDEGGHGSGQRRRRRDVQQRRGVAAPSCHGSRQEAAEEQRAPHLDGGQDVVPDAVGQLAAGLVEFLQGREGGKADQRGEGEAGGQVEERGRKGAGGRAGPACMHGWEGHSRVVWARIRAEQRDVRAWYPRPRGTPPARPGTCQGATRYPGPLSTHLAHDGGDGEGGGHVEAQVSHLAEVGALAAELQGRRGEEGRHTGWAGGGGGALRRALGQGLGRSSGRWRRGFRGRGTVGAGSTRWEAMRGRGRRVSRQDCNRGGGRGGPPARLRAACLTSCFISLRPPLLPFLKT